jgi:hypothetical protein
MYVLLGYTPRRALSAGPSCRGLYGVLLGRTSHASSAQLHLRGGLLLKDYHRPPKCVVRRWDGTPSVPQMEPPDRLHTAACLPYVHATDPAAAALRYFILLSQ